MSEGQLKKRMDLLRQHRSFRDSDLAMLAEFEVMVDEAKKDFAELIHADDPLYWIYRPAKLRNEFLKKFNYWFGVMESKLVGELPSPEWFGDST